MKKLFVPFLRLRFLFSCNKSNKSNEDKALDRKFDNIKMVL